jgi:hypothetical protein
MAERHRPILSQKVQKNVAGVVNVIVAERLLYFSVETDMLEQKAAIRVQRAYFIDGCQIAFQLNSPISRDAGAPHDSAGTM